MTTLVPFTSSNQLFTSGTIAGDSKNIAFSVSITGATPGAATTDLGFRLEPTVVGSGNISLDRNNQILPPLPFPQFFATNFDGTGSATFSRGVTGGVFAFGTYTDATLAATTFTLVVYNNRVFTTRLAESAPFTFGSFPTTGGSSSFTICFQKGTQILTPTGYHLVEQLKAGDALISAKDGSTRVPIKSMVQFIGKKEDGALYCLPKDTLGKNKPLNDLYMSGDHAFKAGPVWKHMKCAAGGAKETDADDIEYFHIILDDYFAHTIVAEGVEVESCFEDKGDGVLMSWACSEVSCTPLKCEFKPIKKASLNAGPIFKLLGNKKEEEKTIIIWAYNKELKRNMPLTCTEITLPK
jgi:hypothetical protein